MRLSGQSLDGVSRSLSAADCKIASRQPVAAGTLEPAGEIVALDENRIACLQVGPQRAPLEDALSLISRHTSADKELREAIIEMRNHIATKATEMAAVSSVLQAQLPLIRGHVPGARSRTPMRKCGSGTVDVISLLIIRAFADSRSRRARARPMLRRPSWIACRMALRVGHCSNSTRPSTSAGESNSRRARPESCSAGQEVFDDDHRAAARY